MVNQLKYVEQHALYDCDNESTKNKYNIHVISGHKTAP